MPPILCLHLWFYTMWSPSLRLCLSIQLIVLDAFIGAIIHWYQLAYLLPKVLAQVFLGNLPWTVSWLPFRSAPPAPSFNSTIYTVWQLSSGSNFPVSREALRRQTQFLTCLWLCLQGPSWTQTPKWLLNESRINEYLRECMLEGIFKPFHDWTRGIPDVDNSKVILLFKWR